jgi:hypothetical protein
MLIMQVRRAAHAVMDMLILKGLRAFKPDAPTPAAMTTVAASKVVPVAVRIRKRPDSSFANSLTSCPR